MLISNTTAQRFTGSHLPKKGVIVLGLHAKLLLVCSQSQ